MRIYCAEPLSCGVISCTAPAILHYLKHVLRIKLHEPVILFDGINEGEFEGTIVSIQKNKIDINLMTWIARHPESPLKIVLAQAVSRGEKMDYTIQKTVELGVTQIDPVLSERCGVKLSQERWDKRVSHWQSIAIHAAEQSGRTHIPIVATPLDLKDWLFQNKAKTKLVLNPHQGVPIKTVNLISPVALLIGPEGGFSESEVDEARACGFVPLTLGPRILRTETAGLAAMAILQAKGGDV